MRQLSGDLAANRAYLAETLQWPRNLGLEFRRIGLATTPPAEALLISVDGLSAVEGISSQILAPLSTYGGPPAPDAIARTITVPGQESTRDCERLIEAVLDGYAALLVDGWEHALLLDVLAHVQHHSLQMGRDPFEELFARDIRVNVALIRKRLRDPKLRAYRVDLRHKHAGEAAILYLEGRASRAVVRAVRLWVHRHIGEETASLGMTQPGRAPWGLLPRFSPIRWATKAAMLIDNGYVVLIVDGVKHVFAAPVTQASFLSSPSDYDLPYPLKRWLARLRITIIYAVLLLPATVVALLNYHQEMVPVGFLLAVASARENAPFGIFFEALGAELVVEAGREASFRLPISLPIGSALVSTVLILLTAVQTGFIGPVPALAAVLGAVISLALPSYGAAYVARMWRFYLVAGAAIMGFFGAAFVLFLLLTHLHQTRSWGVPFFGPTGWEFMGNERASSRRPRERGGKAVGKRNALLR